MKPKKYISQWNVLDFIFICKITRGMKSRRCKSVTITGIYWSSPIFSDLPRRWPAAGWAWPWDQAGATLWPLHATNFRPPRSRSMQSTAQPQLYPQWPRSSVGEDPAGSSTAPLLVCCCSNRCVLMPFERINITMRLSRWGARLGHGGKREREER